MGSDFWRAFVDQRESEGLIPRRGMIGKRNIGRYQLEVEIFTMNDRFQAS